jgi:hypothetical protein
VEVGSPINRQAENTNIYIFLEIAVNFWLEDHFTEAQREDFVQTSTPVIDLAQTSHL